MAARRSAASSSSALFRASHDQDFDPFGSQASSQRRVNASGSTPSTSSRPALTEETNSPVVNMKQSRSQSQAQASRGLKRSPSEAVDLPCPSPATRNSQTAAGTSNGTSNGTNRHIPSQPTRNGRDDSASPSKRRRASPSKASAVNGTPSRRKRTPSAASEHLALLSDDDDDNTLVDLAEAEPETVVPADTDASNQIDAEHRTQRSADRYLPGAIRRVALSNFLTYDSVEFHVGPYLNLICGPNGTGKSSIACAIALGLGGHPSLLGRASQLGSFVKRGETDGWIEIELQAWSGSTNPIIRRTLTTASNKSDWFLSGRSTTKTDILATVAEFNIDVGNLCSFLPQDKVHEFAKMTDAKRLVETEKAVGGAKLVRWHQKLNEYGKTAAEIANSLKTKQEEKAHLEQRNQALQVDVQRFEERRQIEERIEKLDIMIHMADYNRKKQMVTELQQDRETKRRELAEAMQRSQPVRQKRTELEEKTNKLKIELQRLDSVYTSDEKKRRNLVRNVEELGGEIEGKLTEVGALTRKDQDRARRVQELKKEIAERTTQLGDEPGMSDTAEIEADMRRLREKVNDCQTRRGDIQRKIQDVNVESQSIDKGTQAHRQQLAQLDNVRQQRLEKIRAVDESVYRATMWLRENQHRFRKQVHEPVLLEISLKDQRYAAAVESSIPWLVQKAFVCQTREDYDLFGSEVIDKLKMRVTVAENEKLSLEKFKPEVPRDQLQALGFEGYIIDMIEGPEEVLKHLCKQSHLHKLPVTLNPNVDVERIEQSDRFRKFIAGGENFTINVSHYAPDVRQTVSRRIGPARSLVNSVDRERQRCLTNLIQELSAKKKELEAQTLNLLKEDKAIQAELARYEEQLNQLREQRLDCMGAQRQWEKNRAMLDARKRELRDKEREPSAEEKRARLMKEIRKLAQKRSEKMQDLGAQTVQMAKVADRKHIASLSKWQWDATGAQLENMLRDLKEAEKELATSLEETANAHARAKKEAYELRDAVQKMIDEAGDLIQGIDPEDEELLDLDRCLAEMRAEKSKLELAEGVRPEVIDQYRARQREITNITSETNDLLELQTQIETKITNTRSKWEPTLCRVISEVSRQFSLAFDEMGLAGELRIVPDADYEKWKLEIMVKFRNSEELAPLSAQHQSGGERTLSTIMYIMSLLQLSRSPFTLVDEINQGMDPTAERVTHNHIVGLTCQSHANQYFLITPKLLPDLKVHELQKVLLVCNGAYGESGFSFRKVLEKKKRQLGLSQADLAKGTKKVMEAVWGAEEVAEENSRPTTQGLQGRSRRARSQSRSGRRAH